MPRAEQSVKKPDDYVTGFDHIEKFFGHESTRAAVIIFAAKIEELLERLLKKYVVPATASADDLFDGDSPLSTFSAKTRAAYRIGLVDITFVRALDLIRKIRNAFAHDIEGCSLSEEPHRARVAQLVQPIRKISGFELWEKHFLQNRSEVEAEFFAAAAYTLMRLDKIYISVTPLDPDEAYILIPEEFSENTEA
jgi:DNA-binding MltR family transcriptional regulator